MAEEKGEPAREVTPQRFLIVGIGSSAGGLGPLKSIVGLIPAASGCAFVVVPHLDPTEKSHMVEILTPLTKLPVVQAADGIRVERDHVYVIPPDRYLTMNDGILQLNRPTEERGHRRPIDQFFMSLAQDAGDRAVCVILSGTGTNGSAGLRAVKAVGGMAIAQEPQSAEYPAMPQAAIATGEADHICRPEDIPSVLRHYAAHPYVTRSGPEQVSKKEPEDFDRILVLLRARTDYDFRSYKRTTLTRRVQRRMGLLGLEDMGAYHGRLREDSKELAALVHDLMINVTGFFRDPEAWKALEEKAIAPLVRQHSSGNAIRVWVPGCSTGEEAYSIAMLLFEHAERERKAGDIKIFATDTNEASLTVARNGTYAASMASDVTEERLERFFVRQDDLVRVRSDLREAIIFAPQNLLQDPPFRQLDLVSCRNLLIYLEPTIQRKVIPLFHFALKEGGSLFLGSAEGTAGRDELFRPISKKHRVFSRLGRTRHDIVDFPIVGAKRSAAAWTSGLDQRTRRSLPDMAREALLSEFAPPAVLVNRQFEILYFHGNTQQFLRQPPGEPTIDLLAHAPPEVRGKVRSLIQAALKGEEPEGTSVRVSGGRTPRDFRLSARNVANAEDVVLLCFDRQDREREDRAPNPDQGPASSTEAELEREVLELRQELRGTIDQMEGANEELKASNEEVMSMNEELQSSNEELETSKEELQSLNEELNTVNAQLQSKLEELENQTNDLNNLLNSTELATLFVDRNLRIRWFTPSMKNLMSLQPSDIDRPVGNFTHVFSGVDVLSSATQVLKTLVPTSNEVQSDDGRWFVQSTLPYRTTDDRIEGLVMTFAEVSELKRTQRELEGQMQYADCIVDTVREPLIVLDPDLVVRRTNDTFCRTFQVSAEETVGKKIYDLGNGQWNIPALRQLLDRVLVDNASFDNYEVEHDFPALGRRTMLLNARQIDDMGLTLLALQDITERKALRSQREFLIAELNHRVKNLLTMVQAIMSHTARRAQSVNEFAERFSGRLQALARGHDILVRSEWQPSSLSTLVQFALAPFGEGPKLSFDCDDILLNPQGAVAFNMILHELATNAAKYGALSVPEGEVEIECRRAEEQPTVGVFVWREHGGPQVTPPRSKGFGSQLIQRSAQHELGGSAHIDYRREGLECVIRFEAHVAEGEGNGET